MRQFNDIAPLSNGLQEGLTTADLPAQGPLRHINPRLQENVCSLCKFGKPLGIARGERTPLKPLMNSLPRHAKNSGQLSDRYFQHLANVGDVPGSGSCGISRHNLGTFKFDLVDAPVRGCRTGVKIHWRQQAQLIGGLGDDNYVVDNIGDSVTESFGEGTDKVSSNLAYILPGNVENLTLTGTLAINGTGNDLANILLGNSAANQLDGGAGADVLKGAAGNDTYLVDNAGDIITETLNAGNDIVNSSVTYTLSNNVENLTLTGTSAIDGTGNSLSNLIIGNMAANTLNGGTGADILVGGLSNDAYTVDNVGDIITEYLDEGVDKVNTSVSYTLPAHVENLTLTGTAAIHGTGNDLANIIVGNTANNQLNGEAGNDTINGGAGNNTLTGGTGKDYFQFKTADHITAGRIDTITDFSVIDDTIKLDKTVFTVFTNPVPSPIAAGQLIIGSQALDSNDFIIYNSGTGALLYDADGSGSDAAVQFAVVSIGLAMTNADFHVI